MGTVEFEGAHLRERASQGGCVDWWVVSVQRWVLDSPHKRAEMIEAFEVELGQPVILVALDSRGARYWGRQDLVDYMAEVPLDAVPWERFTIRAA